MYEAFTTAKTPDFESGELLLIDKPKFWSSFDVVNKLRWKLKHITGNKKIKVGHAGTLDPLATGLLIICTGKATKQIDLIQADEKEYEAVFKLGATRPSFDLETEINQSFSTDDINNTDIESAISSMIGEFEQTPPIYSAVQINGKRAYEYARKGKEVKLKSRLINISNIKINEINIPDVSVNITCSKGTYIRSLADEFGKKLNNGAYLHELRRVRSGNFCIENAFQLEDIILFLDNL